MGINMMALYEAALRELLARLSDAHPLYSEALVYQQRLAENLAAVRRYRDTPAREADRAEIIDRLNDLAQRALGTTFTAFCAMQSTNIAPAAFGEGQVSSGGGAPVRDENSVASPASNNAPLERYLEPSFYRPRLRSYDDVQLDTLCLDYFPEVYGKFVRGLLRDEKVNLLLEYCAQNAVAAERLERLLKE